MKDAWGHLWHLATDDPDGPALILLDPEDSQVVELVWPDGSRGWWRLGSRGWQALDTLDKFPCDVAARDSL